VSNDPRNDLFHLLGMLESLLKIQKYTRDIHSTEELLEKEDQMVFNACLTLLANIGESINKLKNDLDPLKETFIKIIREGLANKSFDEGEFEAAKSAGFYKFIDFSVI